MIEQSLEMSWCCETENREHLSDVIFNFCTGSLAKWLEGLLMVQETGVQSQVESYQRLKKMVLDATLLTTQHYKARIKSKVEQSSEWSSTPTHLGVVAIEKRAFGSPSTKVANFNYLLYIPLKPNFGCIAWSRQQKTLFSMWTWMKNFDCYKQVINHMEIWLLW